MECKPDPSKNKEEDKESGNEDDNPNECKSMLEENHSDGGLSKEGIISSSNVETSDEDMHEEEECGQC